MKSAKKLKHIYNRLAASPPSEWPVEDRCESISILKQALIASQKPGEEFIIGGKTRLKTLLKATSLSKAWKDHCLSAASRLAVELAGHTPPDSFAKKWKNMDAKEKLQFYKDIITLQSRCLSLPDIAFEPTRIRISDTGGVRGLFKWNPKNKMNPACTKILMNEKYIKSASFENISTVWHEQLHSVMYQLAVHYHNGTIPEDHQFYEDAELMYHRIRHYAHGILELGEDIYNIDTEEALCEKSEKRLTRRYQNHRP